MQDNMAIGSNIANYRQLKKMTQHELAEAIGISRGYIVVVESGGRMPGIKTLSRIADALEVTIEELLKEN